MSSRKRDVSDDESPPPPRKKRNIDLIYRTDEIVPSFDGFQLIGDSQFLRFAEQLLKQPRINENGLAFLGFCISGQKIHDLLNKIRCRDVYKRVSSKVVLMIGTNDLLQKTDVKQMCNGIRSLIDELRHECHVKKLIVLTIPPVPRLRYEKDHWDRLKVYNEFVRSMGNENRSVHVIDAYVKFMKPVHRSSLSHSPRRRSPSQSSFRYSLPELSSPSSILHGTQKCDTAHIDLTLRIQIDKSGSRRTFLNNKSDEEFRQTTSQKRKSSVLTNERDSYDSDDHDDRDGGRDDSILLEGNHNRILENLFEKHFHSGKKDEIHLNRDGLLVIRRLIRDHIDLITLT